MTTWKTKKEEMMIIKRKQVVRMGSCSMAGFSISGIGPLGI
jgi:hypothetical protein